MIKPSRPLQITALGIGFAFLYIPILSLIIYSFNESPLVTVWTEFSLKCIAHCGPMTISSTRRGCRCGSHF